MSKRRLTDPPDASQLHPASRSGARNTTEIRLGGTDFDTSTELSAFGGSGDQARPSDDGITGAPLDAFEQGTLPDGSPSYSVRLENGVITPHTGHVHPNSATTLFGRWTGVATFNDALPLHGRSAVRGKSSFSALDTFSMAYSIDVDKFGHYHQPSTALYALRITRAIESGYISTDIDSAEFSIAQLVLRELGTVGHLFDAHAHLAAGGGGASTEEDIAHSGRDAVFHRASLPPPPTVGAHAAPALALGPRAMEALVKQLHHVPIAELESSRAYLGRRRKLGQVDRAAAVRSQMVEDMETVVHLTRGLGQQNTYLHSYATDAVARMNQYYDASSHFLGQLESGVSAVSSARSGEGLDGVLPSIFESAVEGLGALTGAAANSRVGEMTASASIQDNVREEIVKALFSDAVSVP